MPTVALHYKAIRALAVAARREDHTAIAATVLARQCSVRCRLLGQTPVQEHYVKTATTFLSSLILALLVMALPAVDGGNGPGVGKVTFAANEIGLRINLPNADQQVRNAFMHNGWFAYRNFVMDLSNPRAPRTVSTRFPVWSPHTLPQWGNYLFDERSVYDASDMLNVRWVSGFEAPVLWRHLQYPYLYAVTSYSSGGAQMRITDFSDIRNPRTVRDVDLRSMVGFQVGSVHVIGNLMIASAGEQRSGNATLDISDPINPRLLAVNPNGPGQYFSQVYGNKIYTTGPVVRGQMGVFDFSDPTNIRTVLTGGHQTIGDYANFQGGFVFTASPNENGTNQWGKFSVADLNRGVLQPVASGLSGWTRRYAVPVANMLWVGSHTSQPQGQAALFVHQTLPDNQGPTALYVNPPDGSEFQARTTRIGISFSDYLDNRSITDANVILRPIGGTPVATWLSHQMGILSIAPRQQLLANTTYEVIITANGLKDWSGNGATAFRSVFSTGSLNRGGRPLASFTMTPDGGPAPLSVTFNGSSSSDADGQIVSYAWSIGGATATGATVSRTFTSAAVVPVRLTVTDNAGLTDTTERELTVTWPAEPWQGQRHAVPGRIQAEHFDHGGQGVAYNDTTVTNEGAAFRTDEAVDVQATTDTGGGHNVGYTIAGEWLRYSVNVAQAGRYRLDVRVASATGGGSLRLALNGADLTTSIALPNTGGWQTWQTVSFDGVQLAAGAQALRLSVLTGGFNVNWFELVLVDAGGGGGTPPPPTVAITSPANGATVASSFSLAFTLANWAVQPDGRHLHLFIDGVDRGPHYSSTPIAISNLAPGTHTLRLALAEADHSFIGVEAAIQVTVPQPEVPEQRPYGGVAQVIPGLIQAERYDEGGQGVAYNDTTATNLGGAFRTEGVDLEASTDAGGGHHLSYTVTGEWLIYTVRVNETADYHLRARTATMRTTGAFALDLNGTLLASATVPASGGWQVWQTRDLGRVNLTAGVHELRLRVTGPEFNLNWLEFERVAAENRDLILSNPVATPAVALVGQNMQLSVAARARFGGVVEYQWNFSDGSASTPWSTASTATHRYNRPGFYTIFVRVRENAGTPELRSLRVEVREPSLSVAPRQSSTIAYDAPRQRLWVVNVDNDSVGVIDTVAGTRLMEIPVGRNPRSLALDTHGRVWVTSEGSARVVALNAATGAVIHNLTLQHGAAPFGVVADPTQDRVFVSLSGSGEVIALSGTQASVTTRITVPYQPRALALSAGKLYVAHFLTQGNDARITMLDTASLQLASGFVLVKDTSADAENAGGGIINYVGGLAVSPSGESLWYPATKANVSRGSRLSGVDLNHENTVRTIVGRVPLASGIEDPQRRIDLDDSTLARAVAFGPNPNLAFVAILGNNRIDVVDTSSNAVLMRIRGSGLAPDGMAISPDGNRLYVHHFMSRTVEIFDVSAIGASVSDITTPMTVVSTVATESLAPAVLRGKQIFYNAADPRMSRDSYISCASCHFDGGHDGLVWDFTGRGEGLRNTATLLGKRGTGHGRVHWTGNFDEIQDFEHDIRGAFGGTGFLSDAQFNTGTRNTPLGNPKAGVSPDLDALAAYIASLDREPDSPARNPDGSTTTAAQAGALIFKRLDCASCHSGADFTDSLSGRLHDVGTLTAASGSRLGSSLTGIDTPTLKGIHATAPYFHDGSAATLMAVVERSGLQHGNMKALNTGEKEQLVAYLRQLDSTSVNPGRADEPTDPTDPTDPGGADGQRPFAVSPVQVTASGTARIEAEHYDLGGAGVAYHDTTASNEGGAYRTDAVDIQASTDAGAGFNVGWITAGEWLEYTIEVAAVGRYRVDIRVARQPAGNAALHLASAGSNLSGSVVVPSTGGWQTWTTISSQINLPAGRQVLRLAMDGAGFNVNWLALTRIGDAVPPVDEPSFIGVAINFQPASAPIPAGWLADTSALFADRGNGYRYGWTTAFDQTRQRRAATSPSAVHDTLNHMQSGGVSRVWELAVPNGNYEVTILRGDPSYTDQVNHLLVEGVRMADRDGFDHFDDHTLTVTVTDGLLTVRPDGDAINAKINGITVTRMLTGVAINMQPKAVSPARSLLVVAGFRR